MGVAQGRVKCLGSFHLLPGRLEEDVMMGKMVIGVNAYREVCTLHLAGQVLVDKGLVTRLSTIAAEKAKKTVTKIKAALAEEEELRKGGKPSGFAASLRKQSIMQNSASRREFDFSGVSKEAKVSILRSDMAEIQEVRVLVNEEGCKNFVEVVPNTIVVDEDDKEDEEGTNVDMTDVEITAQKTRQEVLEEKVVDKIELEDDSEEEETVTLNKIS